MRYIVYTEIHDRETYEIERWFYGAWENRNRANEVALELGHDRERGIWHCVCAEEDAADLGILNMWG